MVTKMLVKNSYLLNTDERLSRFHLLILHPFSDKPLYEILKLKRLPHPTQITHHFKSHKVRTKDLTTMVMGRFYNEKLINE